MKKHLLWLLIPLIVWSLAGCDQLGLEDESSLKTVYVGSDRVDCEGEGPQTCYLIKENLDDEWSLWYEEIDGFEYQPGYEYELIVSEKQVADPPAGGSSVQWVLEEVVDKTAVTDDRSEETGDTAESEAAGEELVASEDASAQIALNPITVDDLGVKTVAPANWPKIEDDPLLKDAWGPGQYQFVAFHSVAGEDVQAAMAQLLSSSVDELTDGTIEGEYWEETIGSYTWAMYAIDNPDVGLAQTVSMTEQDGTIYIISLFIEMEQKDSVLQPVLENFAIESAEEVSKPVVEEQGESEKDATELIETIWVLTTYDDGTGQLVNVMQGVEITAQFTEDGRVSGSAGCNDYVSLYTVEDNRLILSIPGMTRKECVDPAGIMLQETGYLGDLTSVASYQIKGSELQLLDGEGSIVLTYAAL